MPSQADVLVKSQHGVIIPDVPLTGGVRNDRSARFLELNEAFELKNIDVRDPSVLLKRYGYTASLIGTTGMSNVTLPRAFLADFDAAVTARLFVTALSGFGGAVYFTVDPTSFSGWTRAPVSKAPTGGATGHNLDVARSPCPYFQGSDLLWIMPAQGTNVHVLTISGGLVDCGSSVNSPPSGAVDGAYLLERAWFLRDDRLYWSKLLPVEGDLTPSPSAFITELPFTGSSGGYVTLSPQKGASAVALKPWRNVSLICFFRNHIEEVIVDPSNPVNSVRNILEPGIGALSRRAIWTFGTEMIFLDNQYNLRSLAETISGESRGIPRVEPLNEKIRAEFPGRLNKAAVDKVQVVLVEGRIGLFYPRDTDTEARHAVWYDPENRVWEMVPAEYGHAFADLLVSDIRGQEDLWAISASGNFALYRFDTSTSDNGTAITAEATMRAWDLGEPWLDKLPNFGIVEVEGDVGTALETWMRTDMHQSFERVRISTVPVAAGSEFPLVYPEDFPLTYPADFPLTYVAPGVFRDRFSIERRNTGDIPLKAATLPVYMRDLPLYGTYGVNRGATLQVKLRESSTKPLKVHLYRFFCTLDPIRFT
jgi:hypothetical protein